MNTIRMGQLLVSRYNKEKDTSYSAKEFFCEVLAPLCLADDKLRLINFSNSSLAKNKNFKYNNFEEYLKIFVEKLENNSPIMSILNAFGGMCVLEKGTSTTSSLYCDNIKFSIEERYCSFIGATLMINVQGNKSFIINNENLVWFLFGSIIKYKEFLAANETISYHQLNKWHGLYFYEKIINNRELCDIVFNNTVVNKNEKGKRKINKSIDLSKFLFTLSVFDKNIKMIELNLFGNTNKSYPPILTDFKEVNTLYEFYKTIYDTSTDFDLFSYNKIFGANLLNNILSRCYIGESTLKPIFIEGKRKDEKKKELYIKYIESTMKTETKELAESFIKKIESVREGSKSKINELFRKCLSSRSVNDFLYHWANFAEKFKVSHEDFEDVIDFMTSTEDFIKKQEFLNYTRIIKI